MTSIMDLFAHIQRKKMVLAHKMYTIRSVFLMTMWFTLKQSKRGAFLPPLI
jgi:hypothetical protein